MSRRYAVALFVVVAAAIAGGALAALWPRWSRAPKAGAVAAAAAAPPAASGRRIKARLFYVSQDGTRLTGVERDVPYGSGTVEQARQIIEAQIAPVAEPLVSPIPAGTRLRALFVSEQGEAYLDLSREVAAGHAGGSTDELLTVYALVDALTANLPAVKSVQLLVDGGQVETLAGHVDLRSPLAGNPAWVE